MYLPASNEHFLSSADKTRSMPHTPRVSDTGCSTASATIMAPLRLRRDATDDNAEDAEGRVHWIMAA